MKTSFYPLIKIKKQELEQKEMEIAQINHLIAHKFDEIAQFQSQMKEFSIPHSGNFQDFKVLQEYKNAFLFQIDSMHAEISNLKQTKRELEQAYQKIYIEYEKLNYIHTSEQKRRINEIKKQHTKHIDEVSTMLFTFNKDKK
ncbi:MULTISPECIES: flagellar export protein FliJ [unclassified Helicobacter]|uniref:flagellar export protein FliJ n=1 Tax=unclassified Helicobacter TaxID=2593540 RepID=UPI000CF0242E|nr:MULTISPECIES: flagellar export protein FliJ [unclassified Helicobacter]